MPLMPLVQLLLAPLPFTSPFSFLSPHSRLPPHRACLSRPGGRSSRGAGQSEDLAAILRALPRICHPLLHLPPLPPLPLMPLMPLLLAPLPVTSPFSFLSPHSRLPPHRAGLRRPGGGSSGGDRQSEDLAAILMATISGAWPRICPPPFRRTHSRSFRSCRSCSPRLPSPPDSHPSHPTLAFPLIVLV
jgi:hypothetical protein